MKLIKVQQGYHVYELTVPVTISKISYWDDSRFSLDVIFANQVKYITSEIVTLFPNTVHWVLYEDAKLYFEDGTIVSGAMPRNKQKELLKKMMNDGSEELPEVSEVMDIIF